MRILRSFRYFGSQADVAISVAFFSFLPPQFSFFFPSLGGPSVEFWWCLKRRGPEKCTFGVLGLSCASLGGPVWWGRRGFTRQPESLNVHISGFRPSKTPTKFHERTPRERKKNENCGARREKKERNFGRSGGGLSGGGGFTGKMIGPSSISLSGIGLSCIWPPGLTLRCLHPSVPPPFGPPTPPGPPTPSGPHQKNKLAKCGQTKLAKFVQMRSGQMRPNKDGQIRFGQMRSRPFSSGRVEGAQKMRKRPARLIHPTRRPPKERRKNEISGGREKKKPQILGPLTPPGPPPLRAPTKKTNWPNAVKQNWPNLVTAEGAATLPVSNNNLPSTFWVA